MFLRNVGTYLQVRKAIKPRRSLTTYLPPRKSQIPYSHTASSEIHLEVIHMICIDKTEPMLNAQTVFLHSSHEDRRDLRFPVSSLRKSVSRSFIHSVSSGSDTVVRFEPTAFQMLLHQFQR
jgi:hypothetical protein